MIWHTKFWNKFSHFLLIGFSALVLFAGVQSGMVGDFTERGPDQALADEDACGGPDQLGCPNPGYDGGEFPLPPPPPAVCTPVFKYNQCVACNESEPVYTNSCTGAFSSGPRQSDAACSSLCPQTPPPPSCTPSDQISTTQHCQSGTTQLCTYNIWRGTDCNTGEGGPYGCVDSPQCGFAQPAPRGQQYSACGISGQLWDANVGGTYRPLQPSDCGSNQFLHVYPPDANGYITNACENIPAGGEKDSDGCGWHQAQAPAAPAPAAPTPTCGRQEVNEGCVDNGFRSFRVIDTCGGFSSVRRVWDSSCVSIFDGFDGCGEFVISSFCSSQSFRTDRVRSTCSGLGEFTRTVWDSNCGFSPGFCTFSTTQENSCVGTQLCTFEVRRNSDCSITRGGPFNCFYAAQCGFVGFPAPQPPVIPGPGGPPGPAGAPGATVIVAAPATFGNVGVARVVTAQASAVQGVKELPKTGLPLLAWAVLAFVPLGFKIRGFSKIKMETSAKPHFLHEERQFKTNLDN